MWVCQNQQALTGTWFMAHQLARYMALVNIVKKKGIIGSPDRHCSTPSWRFWWSVVLPAVKQHTNMSLTVHFISTDFIVKAASKHNKFPLFSLWQMMSPEISQLMDASGCFHSSVTDYLQDQNVSLLNTASSCFKQHIWTWKNLAGFNGLVQPHTGLHNEQRKTLISCSRFQKAKIWTSVRALSCWIWAAVKTKTTKVPVLQVQ